MSFGEKISAIMQRPGQDPQAKDDVPVYLKYGGRIVGSVGGGVAILCGLFGAITILLADVSQFLSGICLMLAGFIVILIEAPCCCICIDYVQQLSDYVDKRPYWNRAAGYIILAIIPLVFDITFGRIIGSACIFATGAIYGMMSIGKKASREEMRTAVVNETQQNISTNTKSKLVENAQPMGVAPRPDSNV